MSEQSQMLDAITSTQFSYPDEPLPCEAEGGDWTAIPPEVNATDVRRRARLCRECPIQEECRRAGLKMLRFTEGIWGGLFIRHGRLINPLAQHDWRRSVHAGVSWDIERRRWKAWRMTRDEEGNRRLSHLGWFDDEDAAGERVRQEVEEGDHGDANAA